jgi:hypothetical protein
MAVAQNHGHSAGDLVVIFIFLEHAIDALKPLCREG